MICKLLEFHREVCRSAFICVEREEEWGETTASADGSFAEQDAPHPHLLLPVSQESGDPLTGRGQHCDLLVEDVWADGVESQACDVLQMHQYMSLKTMNELGTSVQA